jgi:uncharacterized membrane protein YkvA (DUF1232 family)
MGLTVVFELGDADLKHFQLIMQEASRAAASAAPEDIVGAADEMLANVSKMDNVPQFIDQRLSSLRDLIAMVQDAEWRLPEDDARRVLNALAYFSEPEDLIPDKIPGLGYLDDAIMIELAVRELQPELEAYRDFCEFRDKESTRRGVKAKTTDVTREDWLADRREKLQARMRRRRRRDREGSDSGSRFRLF